MPVLSRTSHISIYLSLYITQVLCRPSLFLHTSISNPKLAGQTNTHLHHRRSVQNILDVINLITKNQFKPYYIYYMHSCHPCTHITQSFRGSFPGQPPHKQLPMGRILAGNIPNFFCNRRVLTTSA